MEFRRVLFRSWFSETMPHFKEKVALACINADLVQSTKDCLRYLYPLMQKGGVIISQDGHFPWIIDLLSDDAFGRMNSAWQSQKWMAWAPQSLSLSFRDLCISSDHTGTAPRDLRTIPDFQFGA